MSEEKYTVERVSDDKYLVTKKKDSSGSDPTPTNPDPNARERLGKKMVTAKKFTKIILTLLGDLYGILYRFGSNSVIAILFSWIQVQALILSVVSVCVGASGGMKFLLYSYIALWLIDFITVIIKNDLWFISRIRYKDFKG